MYVRLHPGSVIRQLWLGQESPAAAARRIGVELQEFLLLLDEYAPITTPMATKFEAAGWSTAAFWLRLQDAYDQAPEQRHQLQDDHTAAPIPATAH